MKPIAEACYWMADPPIAPEPSWSGDGRTDVVVIGGGYTGLWPSLFLRELDPSRRVVLLESHVTGHGASGRNRKLALIALLMLLVSSAAWVTREVEVNGPVEYLVVIPAASMLLTIFFDSRVGFYGTVILAYLVGGIWGNDYSLALAGLIGGALSVYTVRDMKNRTQIFRSLGYIFLGYAVAIVALGLERYEAFRSWRESSPPRWRTLSSPPCSPTGCSFSWRRRFAHDGSDVHRACPVQPSPAPHACREGSRHLPSQHGHGHARRGGSRCRRRQRRAGAGGGLLP